jgi:hypothetical protein
MVRRVLVLRAVVVVVEPLPLGDVPVGHQQHPALAGDVEAHALEVLLLPPLRRVVVDAVDEARDVAAPVGADDEAPGRRGRREQGHHAVAVVVLPVPQVVHVPDVLGDDGQVPDEPIRLHREPLHGVVHHQQGRALPPLHHPLALAQRLHVLLWQHLAKRRDPDRFSDKAMVGGA